MTSVVLAAVAGLLACLAYWLGHRRGEGVAARRRRAGMGVPPAPPSPGILALVPAVSAACTVCGRTFRRHPAMVDKRCAPCVAAAIDDEDEAFVESMRAQGWGK